VDTDTDRWSYWVSSPDGTPDWIWREEAITNLLASHQHGHLFVAGCKTNQGKFYHQFDHIACSGSPLPPVLRTSKQALTRPGRPAEAHPNDRSGRC
jgi:hypothetical protein